MAEQRETYGPYCISIAALMAYRFGEQLSMIFEHKKGPTQSRPRLIEWQVCEDERDWQLTTTHGFENSTPVVLPQRWITQWRLRRVVPSLLIVLILLASGGWWIWYNAQMGLAQVETELQAVVAAEPWLPTKKSAILDSGVPKGWQTQIAGEAEQLSTLAEPGELVTKLQVVDLGEDWAVVQVVVQPAGSQAAYRQTRVYQETAQGWARIAPTAAYWGQSRQLATRYFSFHYFAQDAAAVAAVAERLDALYLTLYAAIFSDPPSDEKLIVEIDPALSLQELPLFYNPRDALVIASPAAALAPAELALSDQLAQAVVLALLGKLTDQATQHYNLPPQWFFLRSGVRLWLVWNQELPLSIWRQPIVGWTFWESPTAGVPESSSFPQFAHDLCAQHRLWMRSPIEVGIPIACVTEPGVEELIINWRYPYQRSMEAPYPLLFHLPMTDPRGGDAMPYTGSVQQRGATTVVLATVVEYATTTFGADRLPVLLAVLPEYKSWETLIPAVFGVSAAEFEAGWQAHLAARYGVLHDPAEEHAY